MGGSVSNLLPYVLDAVAVATGNPELIPLTQAAGTAGSNLIQGQSLGKSLGQGGISGLEAFGGQELLGAAGNAFPETAGKLGIDTTGNSLSDLLGTSSGAGSLAGPGTIGGDIAGITSGGTSGNSTMLSRLLSGSGNLGTGNFVNAAGDSVAAGTPGAISANPSLAGSLATSGSTPLSSIASPGAATLSAGGAASSFSPMAIGSTLLGAANSMNANDKAQKDLLNAETNSMNVLAPYNASGGAANAKLSDLLGTSSNTGASGYGALTTPFTAANLTSDPGYQFQLQQGDEALKRQEAAAGNLDSGAAMKAAQTFGQGLAGTTYNNAFQRDLATKGQTYGELAGQGGQGFNAANAAGNIYSNIGNAKANNQIDSSKILNQTLSSLLSGSGAKTIKGYNPVTGQPIFG